MPNSISIDETNVAGSLLVLVCTYNERVNIDQLIHSIHQAVPTADILVMDDASPDGTADAVQKAIESEKYGDQLKLQVRAGKLGLGSAIRDGLHFAMRHGYELAVNLDADFSHDPAAIPDLLAAMNALPENADVDRVRLVIGSRYVDNGGLVNCSWKRKLVSKAANAYARWLLDWKIKDCSSAYRCYRVDSLRFLPWDEIQCNGYGFLEEILWHILHWNDKSESNRQASNQRVVEVPIIYTERALGSSKISMAEATGTLEVLHKLRRLTQVGVGQSRRD